MKIRQLHINRFGHFLDTALSFSGEGIQLIYGPNEAGKTTLLEFLRGLLFDFPIQTPYNFGTQGELSGVGQLVLQDGRKIELRRRKGNKNKVAIKIDDQPTDIDDKGWFRLMDHADRGLFESVFAFGLDQLAQGEASLKHQSVQSALFSGGLGGAINPDHILTQLTKQQDDLFKKSRGKAVINEQLTAIKELSKRIKEKTLRPAEYQKAEEAVEIATQQARKCHLEVEQLRKSFSRIDKLVRAWPLWWQRHQDQSERESLTVPENIPANARQQYTSLRKELSEIEEEQTTLAQEIEQIERELGNLTLNPVAIEHRAEINSCLELRKSYMEARDQLPDRLTRREGLLRQINQELTDLRLGWSHDDLRAFNVDLPTRDEIRRLNEETQQQAKSRLALTAKQEVDSGNLQLAQEELENLEAPRDLSALSLLLSEEAEYLATQKKLTSLIKEQEKLERTIQKQVRKLSPPCPESVTDPQNLPVPREETIAEFASRFSLIRDELKLIAASVEEEEARQRELETFINKALSSQSIPTLDERDEARNRREAGWKLIREKYISENENQNAISEWIANQSTSSLPDGYEQAVQIADDIADRIYRNADEVARRETLRHQFDERDKRMKQKRQDQSVLEQQRHLLNTEWEQLWQPCGFVPLSPEAMAAWRVDHTAVCELVDKRDELLETQRELTGQTSKFEQQLRTISGLEETDLSRLLPAARAAVDDAKEQNRKITEFNKTIRSLSTQLKKTDEKLQELSQQESETTARWQTAMERLNLPVEWSQQLAHEAIHKLHTIREKLLFGLPDEDSRIEAMESRIEEFDQRTHSLCEVLSPNLQEIPGEIAIKKLDEMVDLAIDAQQKHDRFRQSLDLKRIRDTFLTDRRHQLEPELTQFFELTGATTEAGFLEVVSRAERAAQLEQNIDQLTREIDLIRTTEDRIEFENTLAGNDQNLLQSKADDLSEQLKASEERRRIADGDEAVARGTLKQLDGSGEVALLTEELACKQSLLSSEIDRYMPVVYARHFLKSAVDRFEKENRPAMVATVSDLFRQMTGGRYVEFDRSGSGKQSLVVQRSDGAERTPEQLSTGTREQLYLAIRLAYILHYCQQNEPLPIIIDDVLANFDQERIRSTLKVLDGISNTAQILFFTCHRHLVDLAHETLPGFNPISLTDV